VPASPLPSDQSPARGQYWLTRFLFLRLLGLIYLLAFLVLVQQGQPLLGERGLLPACNYLARVDSLQPNRLAAVASVPTVFWLGCSDALLAILAWTGVGLAALLLIGVANVPLLLALWSLYLSFCNVGQLFYGYGWEILLLETGFLAIFLCPWLDPRPFPRNVPPPTAVIWLLRWVLFRVMFGAGLIKLRGDPCWRDLTCMLYHYETQPLPNPLSWYMHQLPPVIHKVEVLFNHFVELIVPWSLFAPRRLRHIGGLFLVLFQFLLILSGNLSWLNWLTLTLCVACFDDAALAHILPARLTAPSPALSSQRSSRARIATVAALVAVVAYLSIDPVRNLLAPQQAMNASFDPFHLVNTYGAFGSIGRQRREIILEGTADETIGEGTRWKPYEFKCKPGDVDRRPCIVAPYHYRIDWQMWFAAMQDPRANPWLIHLIYELLQNDPGALSLLASNPFPARPPHFIRAELYEYAFTRCGDKGSAWWTRQRLGPYLPPLALDDPALLRFVHAYGWADDAGR
jgi:hypothetical protein